MEIEQETAPKKTSWLGICAILAAIGASLCCPFTAFIPRHWRRMDEYLNVNASGSSLIFHPIPDFYWFRVSQTLLGSTTLC